MDYDLEFRPLDFDFLISENDKKPTKRPKGNIIEYVEEKRIMSPDSPFPGFYDAKKTPYMVDPANDMSPESAVREVSLMKGVQLGATTGLAENVMAYYMGECPTAILFVTATQDNLAKWTNKKFDPLIQSCGIELRHSSDNKQNRKSGDTSQLKEFIGGSLLLSSAQSPTGLRQDSVRVLIRDEIDGAPVLLVTGEGSWLSVSEARTFAWDIRAKIANISTPTTYEESNIFQKYLDGDQRIFLVPCPLCGKFQQLRWGNADTQYGIRADTVAGRVKKVYYLCDHCHDAFFNTDKLNILGQGRWEPTAVASRDDHHSYHVSALYSPVGMFSWETAYHKFLEAEQDPVNGMRSFTNLVLGEPYKDAGSTPKRTDAQELVGAYHAGTVPDGALFLTAAVDLQHGTKNNPDKPARLEMEVCGHGLNYRTWSITHEVFKGAVEDPYDGAFEALHKFAEDGGLKFYRSDGIQIPVVMTFMDSSEGNTQGAVFEFCRRWRNAFPTKGFKFLSQRKDERIDEMAPGALRRYRFAKSGNETFYEVNTNFYKNIVYNSIEIPRTNVGPQRPGFCDFPREYGAEYFKQLVQAEERRYNGREFVRIGQRSNEALDLRVLNLCAAHVFLDNELRKMQDMIRKNGATKAQVEILTVKNVLEDLQTHLDNAIASRRAELAS